MGSLSLRENSSAEACSACLPSNEVLSLYSSPNSFNVNVTRFSYADLCFAEPTLDWVFRGDGLRRPQPYRVRASAKLAWRKRIVNVARLLSTAQESILDGTTHAYCLLICLPFKTFPQKIVRVNDFYLVVQ
jgi:hypothetical protein